MKKHVLTSLLALGIAAGVVFSFTACAGSPSGTDTDTDDTAAAAETGETGETMWTGVLVADFSYGVSDEEWLKEYPFEYTGSEKTVFALAEELSALTGLDFSVSAYENDDGIVIDWQADSTLVGGLDDREQKEEFFFYDVDTLSWFMLDSLWRTVTDNMGVENVYYTMNGGGELTLPEISHVNVFPSDIPYMGSVFYFAHSDNVGDEGENIYAKTKGTWRLDGVDGTASISMNGIGDFSMFYADGNLEAAGTLDYTDEYGDGNFTYIMYGETGEVLGSFTFDSDTQIHLGNTEGAVYILEEISESNVYYDENTGYLLTYPNTFAAVGTEDDLGRMHFPTLWDAALLYYTTSNENTMTPAEFMTGLEMTACMELDGNVVVAYGESTDDAGNSVPTAFYWVVDRDCIVHLEIRCTETEEAAFWYEELQNRAFYIEAGIEAVG